MGDDVTEVDLLLLDWKLLVAGLGAAIPTAAGPADTTSASAGAASDCMVLLVRLVVLSVVLWRWMLLKQW